MGGLKISSNRSFGTASGPHTAIAPSCSFGGGRRFVRFQVEIASDVPNLKVFARAVQVDRYERPLNPVVLAGTFLEQRQCIIHVKPQFRR